VNPMPVPLQKVLQEVAIDAKRIMPTILPGAEEDMKKALACNLILKAVEDVAELITHTEGVVRWFEYADKGKSVLKTAPLRIGPTLVSQLKERDMNMIVTSATITVG